MEPRRNPKRKAQEQAEEQAKALNIPENLLEEALAPMTPEEIQEWEGWQELESDPVRSPAPLEGISSLTFGQAFFNLILRDLGVKDVKTQEIFALDDESCFAALP